MAIEGEIANQFAGVTGLFGGAVSILKWAVIAILIGGLIIGAVWFKRRTVGYNIKVLYVRLINGVDVYGEDVGGVFTQSGKTYFKIKNAKVIMRGDKIPFRITDSGKKIVFLSRIAAKSYAFNQAKPTLMQKLRKEEGTVIEGLKTLDEEWTFMDTDIEGYDNLKLTVTEEDVENAIHSFKAGVKTYATNKLEVWLPTISLTLVVLVVIFMLHYVSQWVPQITGASTTIADSIKQTANVCSSGSVIG